MRKIIATGLTENLRVPLQDISNCQIDPGRIAALNYNKDLLAKAKENLATEAAKRIEAEQQIAIKDFKLIEAEKERATEAAKRIEAEQRAKDAEQELAQMKALLAALQEKK